MTTRPIAVWGNMDSGHGPFPPTPAILPVAPGGTTTKTPLKRPRAMEKTSKIARGRTGVLMSEAVGSGACEKRLPLPTGGLPAPGSSSKQARLQNIL